MDNHGFFGRLAYRASYGLSYGVVYPVALAGRVVPKENPVIYGLTDGAAAARDEALGLGRRAPAAELAQQDTPMVAEPT